MLTSKQRAYCRALAYASDSVLTVGKTGVTANTAAELENAFHTRELVKGTVLETSPLTAKEAANELAAAVNAELVQVIGRKFVLYRRSADKPVIVLP